MLSGCQSVLFNMYTDIKHVLKSWVRIEYMLLLNSRFGVWVLPLSTCSLQIIFALKKKE